MKFSILLFVLCSLPLISSLVSAKDEGSYSIEDLYYSVEKVSEPADKILILEDIIKQHQKNEALYSRALLQLVTQYEEANEPEKAFNLLIQFIMAKMEEQKGTTFIEIRKEMSRLKEAYPEVAEKALSNVSENYKKPKPITNYSSNELVESVLQRNDEYARENALEQIAALLAEQSSDEDKKKGLSTLGGILTAKFTRTPFRSIVLPLLKSKDEEVRALALDCIAGLETPDSELANIATLVDDQSERVRSRLANALIQIDQGKNPEIVIPVLSKLLNDEDYSTQERTVNAMWGQYSSEEFDTLLVDLSFHEGLGDSVIYHCLSTMKTKGVKVCKRLIEVLDDPDWNNSGRAAWGLGYGVQKDAYTIVELGLLKALPQETNHYTRKQMFRALQNVASENSREYLEKVVNSNLENQESKELAWNILNTL
ncbi:MAG: HEAT repeat domain-containing protein [Sumerlaeia bacterium]